MRLRSGTRVFPDGTRLTPRQEQVARFLSDGLTNGQIAERLGITLDGAKFHVTEVMNRFGVHSREDAAAAWRDGRGHARTFSLAAPAKAILGTAAVGAGVVAVIVWAAILRNSPAGNGNPASADDLAAMRSAVEQTKTARFTMEIEIQPAGGPTQPLSVTGQVDFEHGRSSVSLQDGGEQIYADGTQYMRLGQGKWQTFPTGASAGLHTTLSAKYWLTLMEDAADARILGTEQISGAPVTHYAFSTHPQFENQPGLNDLYKYTTFHWEVWIGEVRLVRMEQRATYEGTGTDIDGQRTFQRIELSHWNEPVDIRVPRPDEIAAD